MKKTLTLLFALFCTNALLTLTYSCRKTVDKDPCNTSQQYVCGSLDSISWKPYKTAANISVKATDLVIIATLLGNDVVCKSMKTNPFITSAYACTPPLPIYNIKDSIESMSITSNNDFDTSHPAGTLLNDYFNMPDLNRFNTMMHNGGYGAAYKAENSFEFKLLQSPSDTGTHIFTLTLKHKSGNIRTVNCVPIQLLL